MKVYNMIGIDLGSENIKMMLMSKGRKPFRHIIVKTPLHAVEDGFIKDPEAFKEVLYPYFYGKGKFDIRRIAFSILSSQIIIRDIEVPLMNDKELKGLVSNLADEYIPVPLKDYLIDFKPLNIIDNAQDKKQRILLVASPKKLIENYIALVESLKLDLAALDIYQNAITKAVKYFYKIDKKDFTVLDIGAKRSVITFFSKGIYSFSRIIDFGGSHITQLISNFYNLPLEKAEKMKMEMDRDFNNLDFTEIFNGFGRDLLRYFDYFRVKNKDKLPEILLMTGGGSSFKPLYNYLRENININVTFMDDKTLYKGIFLFLSAMGACVREDIC